MTFKNAKTFVFASLIAAMILPFSTMAFAENQLNDETLREPEKSIDDACFDKITEEMSEIESNLDLEFLKQKANDNPDFNELKSDRSAEFKNTIQYWKVDPSDCTFKLKQIDVKYNLDKETDNYEELIVSINGETNEIIETKLAEPYTLSHTNYTEDSLNWAGITQMDGTTESTSAPTKARGFFDVPTITDPTSFNCGTSSTTNCVVSAWAGLSEDREGNDLMVQSGTDSTCKGNNCGTSESYNAWLEKVENGSSTSDTCSGLTVNAEDSVRAYTYYYDATDKYTTGVFNYDEFDVCSTSYENITEDAHYGQFVVERPSNSGVVLPLGKFTDFPIEAEIEIGGTYEGLGDYSTLGHTWKYRMGNYELGYLTTNVQTAWPDSSDFIDFDYVTSAGTD